MRIFGVAKNDKKREKMHVPSGACDMHIMKLLRMPLSDLWEHTITRIFKLDPKYKVDYMIRQWVIYNKLEDFNSLLNYTDEDFKPYGAGSLSCYKENGDSVVKMMSTTPLQMLENLRWYIQHLINESGYLYDDDNPIIL